MPESWNREYAVQQCLLHDVLEHVNDFNVPASVSALFSYLWMVAIFKCFHENIMMQTHAVSYLSRSVLGAQSEHK